MSEWIMPKWLNDSLNIFTLLVSIISMVGFPNLMRRFGGLERLSKSRIEYRQAKELIHILEQAEAQGKEPHPYLIEKGYGAISGMNNLTSQEIIYCLSMKAPNQALRFYSFGLRYLGYSETVGKVCFGEKINDRNKRIRSYALNYIGFFIFSAIAAVVLWIPTQVNFKNPNYAFIFLAFSSLYFIGLSYIFMSNTSNLSFAEKFMKLQAEMLKDSDIEASKVNMLETGKSETKTDNQAS